MNSAVSCPSCGATIESVSAHTRSLQCPHCDNWVYLGNNGWAAAGAFEHALDAPSFVQLGRSGKLEDRSFVVAGRIRLAYSRGYWDEWWLEFDDGQHQWLEEDDGRYRLHQSIDTPANIADPRSAKPGQKLSVNGEAWFVTESIQAQIVGAEGSLPAAVSPSETVMCIDAIFAGQKYAIESSDLDVHITQSRVIAGDDFVWS
jgi:hypothetical protein